MEDLSRLCSQDPECPGHGRPAAGNLRSRWNCLVRATGGTGMCFVVLSGLLLAATAAGCRPKTREVAAEVPVVPVSHPIQRVVTEYVDFTGRADAVQSVNIIARVTGYLVPLEKPFKEGSEVKKGDLLFEIDPRPYQGAVRPGEEPGRSQRGAARSGEDHVGALPGPRQDDARRRQRTGPGPV